MSDATTPRAVFAINGTPCSTLTALELETCLYRRAGSFRATLAYAPDDTGIAAALNAEAGAAVSVAVATDAATFVTLFRGVLDLVAFDVHAGLLELEGRDDAARLIDLPIATPYTNQTASEIASALAEQVGLASSIVPTGNFSGQFYQIDHARSALQSFARFGTAWELLCGLADQENYDVWVANGTLYFVPAGSVTGQAIALDVAALRNGAAGALDLTRLRLERRPAYANGVGVTVRSWNSRQKTAITQTASATSADSATIVFVMPNETDQTALARATALAHDINRHGAAIAADMAGELTVAPRDIVTLTNTAGGTWDGPYMVDLVTRRIDACRGFEQSFIARRMSN